MHPIRHLYVHVPFCPTICPFCDFHVLERRRGVVDQYLDRLDTELAEAADRHDLALSTVYLGGGTPSHLRASELERLVSIVGRRVGWATDEATLEVHPSTATAARARRWVELGFDRLSVGAQSFDDGVLRTLGRPHDAAAGRSAVDWRLDTGATTSLDVISAVPGQDLSSDLSTAVATGAHHVSVYTLTIEPGTPFEREGVEVPEDDAADALATTARVLGGAGYERYEVSNHARPGARCEHNQAYWRHRPYLGVGPSAASCLPATDDDGAPAIARVANAALPDWLAGAPATGEVLAGRELVVDLVVCGLRTTEGVDLDAARRRWGTDVLPELPELGPALDGGLLEVVAGRLRCTDAGWPVVDTVLRALV